MRPIRLMLTTVFALAIAASCAAGEDRPVASKPAAAGHVDSPGLLDGLEGYAAEGLRSAFRAAKIRRLLVTKSTDAGGPEPGTLRYCVEQAKKALQNQITWIVFDPQCFPPDGDVKIELTGTLDLGSNTVIDGRGARVTIHSSRDIHLFRIRDAHNIVLVNLILHKVAPYAREKFKKGLHFPVAPRAGVTPERARQGVDRDAVTVRGAADNLWIHHCTFFLCGDECIGLANVRGPGTVRVTLSWCEFSDQYYVALIGHTKQQNQDDKNIRLTFHHNWIRGAARRSPRVNRATADVYNNYYDGWVDWAIAANTYSRVLVEANLFEPRGEEPRLAINIGTTDQIEGYVKVRDNLLTGGGVLNEHMPDRVEEPTYPRRVSTADARLKETIRRRSGWQKLSPGRNRVYLHPRAP